MRRGAWIVGRRFVRHLPDAVYGLYGDLRRGDRHEHLHNQRDGGEPLEQSQEQEQSANDLHDTHK